jgi:uncharacterized protein (TIGR03437 family)
MKPNTGAGYRFRTALAAIAWLAAGTQLQAQSAGFKVTPATLNFTYQIGDTKLPTPLNVTVSVSSSTQASFAATISGGPWLNISPAAAVTPASAKVSVNPSTLPVGTYTGTITLATSESTPQTAAITVTLIVRAPLPTLTATPSPMSLTYVRGDPAPSPLQLALSTSGSVLSYSVSAAGGNWLTVSPKSGVSFPAFPSAVNVTINPTTLAPGTYKGTLTVAAPQAANKSQTVTVNLTVNAGLPALDSIWPTQVTQGAPNTIITLTGSNFFSGTIVRADLTTLSATLIGPNVMTAVIPSTLLASAGTMSIVATNSGPGGGDSAAQTFTVASTAPTINAVVNAASFLSGAVAPGEMVSIFGSGLGPETLTTFTPPSGGGTIATTLAGTRVLFDTTAAPILFTASGQLGVMTPYDVAGKATVDVIVEYNSVQSAAVTLVVAQSAPGIFTAAGTGSGAAVAFNFDETTSAYTMNTDSALAPRGTIVVLFATGEGVTTPASTDGSLVTAPASAPNSAITVQIGGQEATVLYTGGVVGLVSGLIQINARVPLNVVPSKTSPLVVTMNGIQSQPGVTIGIK